MWTLMLVMSSITMARTSIFKNHGPIKIKLYIRININIHWSLKKNQRKTKFSIKSYNERINYYINWGKYYKILPHGHSRRRIWYRSIPIRTLNDGRSFLNDVVVIPWVGLEDFRIWKDNDKIFSCLFTKKTLKKTTLRSLQRPHVNNTSKITK
jgi:hypothetical protein